jgi:hypothetical protein
MIDVVIANDLAVLAGLLIALRFRKHQTQEKDGNGITVRHCHPRKNSGWKTVNAFTGNGRHSFKVKSITPVRSRITGDENIRILIVQPLRYRLSQKTRLLYRDPAYLICTDPGLDDVKILQYYLWRREIEVNFKDEKTTFGIHEPQVRIANSVESVLLTRRRETQSRFYSKQTGGLYGRPCYYPFTARKSRWIRHENGPLNEQGKMRGFQCFWDFAVPISL